MKWTGKEAKNIRPDKTSFGPPGRPEVTIILPHLVCLLCIRPEQVVYVWASFLLFPTRGREKKGPATAEPSGEFIHK